MQGSGNIVTETRSTGNFSGVAAGGAFEVEIKNGPATQVVVEADDNIIKYITTNVSGNTLKISTRDNTSFNNAHFKVYVTAPDIDYVRGSGAATVIIKNILKSGDKIKVEASGASNITGELDAPNVETEASGASTITISGRTKKYIAEASGSSNLKTSGLMSESAEVHASGASTAHVYTSVNLVANSTGASTIHYKGDGSLSQNTSGASSVKKDD